MQQTRKLILEYLKEHSQATVDELAEVLKLTSVTVRHHLDILRSEELVGDPLIRHRSSAGRPQYIYALTKKASGFFPNNYGELASKILDEIEASTPPQTINVIFEGVANRFAAEAPQPAPGETMVDRLDRTVAFLNQCGYIARWETAPDGYLLHTCNCPYEVLAPGHPELCVMDMTLVSNLLGTIPQRVARLVEGAESCTYLIRQSDLAPTSNHNKIEDRLNN